ncbi:MAG: hypothetical protein KGI08_10775 [Thaumarchaeota archaeon]|nr:hypothetical protein [Nitrososphaerota archaeon]
MINYRNITPKFIRRILVLREYRITKAIIKNLKDPEKGEIVFHKDLMENWSPRMLRSKVYYEAMYEYYCNALIQHEGRLEELKHEMRELGVKLE